MMTYGIRALPCILPFHCNSHRSCWAVPAKSDAPAVAQFAVRRLLGLVILGVGLWLALPQTVWAQAATETPTDLPPTATPTDLPPTDTPTPLPPTATPTDLPPTDTPTPLPPTATPTALPPSATPTLLPPTATPTALPPTATFTPLPPTATFTPLPPTATPTPQPPNPTATSTPVIIIYPTSTATPGPPATPTVAPATVTPLPATATATVIPATATVRPATATPTQAPATVTSLPVTPRSSPTATPSPTITPTAPPTATPTPQPVIQTLTLAVLDGWDELFADRLSQLDQVGVVTASDDDRWEIAANSYTSFEFESALPAGAVIQTVKLFIEHSEDPGLAPAKLIWEVGQGDLQKPTIGHSQNPALLTADREMAVEWDITARINTPAQVAALKLLIRNSDASASTWIDHLYLVVTYTGDVTVPPTPTPQPAAINLQGRVELEGRPTPPNPQWALPLSINLRTTDAKGNSSTRGFSLLTGADGTFQMNDLPAGAYQVAVKGAHTLQRVVNVELKTGDNPIQLGLLREGDAVNDNRINILDFSRLASAFGRCATMTNYLASADFDQDSCITLADVALLVQNFGHMGEVLGAPQLVETASVQVTDPIGIVTSKRAGERFTMLLAANNLGNQPLDAVALYVNFDPTQLEVVNLAGSATLPLMLLQQVDNAKGQLDYAAGILGEGTGNSPALLAITFAARRNFLNTPLIIETAGLRQSTFAYRGQAITTGAVNGGSSPVAVQEVIFNQNVFLPVISAR